MVTNGDHKVCYGTMFPELRPSKEQLGSKGKAFSYEMTRTGGFLVTDRQVRVDIKQWDDCRRCEEFEDCYKLCLGKLSLATAIAQL